MKLIPHYRISYHHEYFEAGQSVVIDPADKEEMEIHGVIFDNDKNIGPDTEELAEKTSRKPGRPKKVQ